MRTWTPARVAELQRLIAEGLSIGKAAKALGVARGSACWATARFGIGRQAADLTRPWRAKGPADRWTDDRLTERWADRRTA